MFGLTPYERKSYDLFNAFHDFENDFFNGGFPQAFKTDIKDNGDSFTIDAELPGYRKEDINIDINGDVLTISAQHDESKEEKDDKGRYIRRERSFGSVSRSFDVANIKTEDITAAYTNGVLTLNMPKKAATVPTSRRLEIK